MRKTFGGMLAVAALMAPAGASAQGTSGDVTASAQVVAAIQVFEEADLSFGAVVPNVDAIVTPGAAVPGSMTRGALRIEHSSNFSVSAGVPAVLNSGGNTLAVTFQCGYSSTQNGALNGGSFDCGSPPSPGTAPGVATTTWMQVGGTILGTDIATAVPGAYSATLSFSFTATL